MSGIDVPTIEQELELEQQMLKQAKTRLRQVSDVEEQIAARMLIGKHTQRIRRLNRELQEGY